jgi:hypothetical protein
VGALKPIAPRTVFADPDSIARFGVGKNMVSAIRHWALACDVIREVQDGYAVGEIGKKLFGRSGLDPYLEHPASAWLIHWHLAGEGRRSTTWYWLFNHVPGPSFDREEVVRGLKGFCDDRQKTRASISTLARDVDVCLRGYSPREGAQSAEEFVEPVLGDLGLIAHTKGSEYTFRIGPKPSLPDGVLLHALTRFWDSFAPSANSMSLDVLAFEPGAIGPVFKLDVESLAERLVGVTHASEGCFTWSETAGLKQIIRNQKEIDPLDFLPWAYRKQAA